MADNVELDAGSGGDTIAADDIAGIKYPRSKITLGADGTNDGDVSSANPLPIEGTVDLGATDNAVLDAIAASLAGTLAVNTELPTAGALADDATNPTTVLVGACLMGFDGTTWDRLRTTNVNADDIDQSGGAHQALDVMGHNFFYDGTAWDRFRGDSTNGLLVNLGSNNDVVVTNAGTFAVQESGAALTALQLIDDVIYADDGDWTDGASKHALVGGLYQSSPQSITDGDVGPFQVDVNGNLKVAIVSGAGSGGTAAADDADFVAGTTNGTPAMGVYESSPSSVTDGDLGTVGITAERALKVAIVSGAGSGGTASTDDADFSAGATSGTPAMGVYESSPSSVTDGDMGLVGITQTRAMRVNVDNTVTVGSHAVTNAGTFAVQAAQNGTWTVDLGATDNAVLDSIATLLGTIDTDTGSIATSASTLAGAVSGSEMQVDIVSGTVTANAGTNLNTSALALETGGNLAAAATSLATLDNIVATDRAQVNPIAGQAGVAAGSGTVGATTQRVCLATDVALPAGTNNIGDVDVLSIAAGTNAIGDVGLVPRTTGGCDIFRSIDLDETEEEVKATAGQVYGYYFFNASASVRFIKWYNATAANVTVGTTTPVLTLPIPAGAAGHVSLPVPMAFSTAITVAATTAVADNDTGAPSANDVVLNVLYK